MWPKLSNIEDSIYNNLTAAASGSSKVGFEASQRVAWVRIFSGAKVGKRNGLVLSSANKSDVFNSTTEFKQSTYGNSVSSGDVGLSWEGGVITSGTGAPLRPSPIVTALELKEGKDQISRECTLTMKAFTLAQMELMQTYFLEPGYSLCIEYGWNSINGLKSAIKTNVDKNKTGNILSQAVSRNLNYDKLHKIRVNSRGDYDSFLGFIVGGSVSSDGDTWNISVRLRGAPGLPTFLQNQNKSLKLDSTGNVLDTPGEPKPYGVSETEIEGSGEIRRDRRFKNMFNQLPSQRQTEQVKALMAPTNWDAYLNMDAAVNKSITTYANPGWISRTFGGADNEIKVGESTIEKEKLFSKNKYIKFDLAVDILNSNSQFTAYRMGNKDLTVKFDISKSKIGAFPNMFSTKASKLVIPGFMPDFAVYFLNEGQIDQLKGGVLRSNGIEYPIVRNVIPGTPIQFVEQSDLKPTTDGDGLSEKAQYWGYLRNLYINFDLFVEKLQQKNKNVREVFVDMLNEMSSAVNSFWNFQIVEQKDSKGNIIISVIDENWIGNNPDDNIKTFNHAGPYSIFLDANLDISMPSEMTNQIISRRLALANNPDEPIVGVGGFFNSQKDLFLDDVTDVDGKPRKKISEEAKKAEEEAKKEEQKEKEKKPSEKIEEEIGAGEKQITDNKKTISDKEKEIKAIKSKYALLDFDYSDADKAAIDKLKADVRGLEKANDSIEDEVDKKESDLDDVKEKEVEDEKENKKSALSNNLAKIDVLPKPELAALAADKIGNIADITKLKELFVIYCLNDEPFFDRMKNDAFSDNKKNGTLSHPLPIKYNFKIMGTSGIRRGDMFNINGIPRKYAKHGLFQVTQIEQNVEGMMWTTNVTGEYRQKQ